MAKPNFRQMKRQKELARKTRQQAKQQRRADRAAPPTGEASDEVVPPKS